jgi:hypothetical protein
MLRLLTVAISCCAGAAAVWLFTPTIQPVAVNPDMPSFSRVTEEDLQQKPRKKTTMMSGEKRQARAEQLIGKEFKYITGDEVHSADWFSALETPQLERAMDECFLISDVQLSMQHAEALRDEDADKAELIDAEDRTKSVLKMVGSPNLKQLQTCKNVFVAYWAKHGEKFEF